MPATATASTAIAMAVHLRHSLINAVARVIITHRKGDGLLRQHRAMDFCRGQAAKLVHHIFIGDSKSLLGGLADNQSCGNRGCGNGGTATESEESGVGYHVVSHFDMHFHDVAAFGVAHLAHAVSVWHFAYIAGVHEVVENCLCVHGCVSFRGGGSYMSFNLSMTG